MKGIVLLSGGIDSPVAAYVMGSQGADLVFVHFDNRPFVNEDETAKAGELMRRLEGVLGAEYTKILVPHGEFQRTAASTCSSNHQCILCRRMMFRVAEKLAPRFKADCIITGESLGQVASQTLSNIAAEDQATELPVIRPLIGLDKIEIERIARRIGTFDISTRQGTCCTVAPKKPVTYGRLEVVLEEESRIDIDLLATDEASGAREIR